MAIAYGTAPAVKVVTALVAPSTTVTLDPVPGLALGLQIFDADQVKRLTLDAQPGGQSEVARNLPTGHVWFLGVTSKSLDAVGAYQLTAPSNNLKNNPDTIADTRVGFDVRLFGAHDDAFRLGAGAQLIIPSGDRADYDTDGTYRAMGRLLFAGDVARFTYAGLVGVHIRPLDDAPAPGSPQGSELLFGVAAGAKIDVAAGERIVVGPEIFGETALRSFFSTTGTGLEALVSARVEGTGEDGPQLRLKLGAGGGLDPHFGAPAWRAVVAIELFDHAVKRVEH